MGVVLLSCYELGHPPHGLALPAAFLARAGVAARVQDLAREPLDEAAVRDARFVGISVPMHTALRLGAVTGARVRQINPRCHLCFFGLYAPPHARYLRALGADSILGGEHEHLLVSLATGSHSPTVATPLERLAFPVPRRDGLPGLDRYAKLVLDGRERLAGYSETTRGCRSMCRHCPIPPIYGGRLFAIDADTVLADVAAQVAAGAEHITFGDPDFFNGPNHGLRVARAVHDRWPSLTFDVTIKVSHLLRHAHHLGELARLGCAFVVTAVESLDDDVLRRLDKGHTRADVARALALARAAGLVLRPTYVPFTPWTTLASMCDLVAHIERHDLVDCVAPVQLSVRLLVPPGSLLLASEPSDTFGPLDPAALTHTWIHHDPRVDALQRDLARRAEEGQPFARLRDAIHAAAGTPQPALRPPSLRTAAPRLTEPWFC